MPKGKKPAKVRGGRPRGKTERAPSRWAGERREVNEDWFRLRLSWKRGMSLAELSREMFNNHKDQLARSLKQGGRKFSLAELQELAAALDVPLVTLFRQLGYPTKGALCDLWGYIDVHGRVTSLPPEKIKQVPAPTEMEAENLVALQFRTTNTKLHRHDNVVMYFAPPTEAVRTVPGAALKRLSVTLPAHTQQMVVGYLEAPGSRGPPVFTVTPIGSDDVQTFDELVWAVPVMWQKLF